MDIVYIVVLKLKHRQEIVNYWLRFTKFHGILSFSLERYSTGHMTGSEMWKLVTEAEPGMEPGTGQGLFPFPYPIGYINKIKYWQERLK